MLDGWGLRMMVLKAKRARGLGCSVGSGELPRFEMGMILSELM